MEKKKENDGKAEFENKRLSKILEDSNKSFAILHRTFNDFIKKSPDIFRKIIDAETDNGKVRNRFIFVLSIALSRESARLR